MKLCSVDGCGAAHHGRGLCSKHWMRMRANGSIELIDRTRPLRDRFWEKVDKSGSCWIWTGSILKSGYGNIRDGDRVLRAHRVAYELSRGPIPTEMQLDHICRNRACVRPEHLRLASNKENQENRIGWRDKALPRGVTERYGRYRARVMHNRKQHFAGWFESPDEAAEAAKALRLSLFTHNTTDRIQS